MCELGVNQRLSNWYAFIVLLVSSAIILLSFAKIGMYCYKYATNQLQRSAASSDSYDYSPVD